MKVFISWSGTKSRHIAEALHTWLPYILQPVKPFMSSGDIRKGARWSDVLAQELEATKYGIICITRQNIMSSWLNFEAGALSKMTGQACVSPVLFGVDPSQLTGPLSQFQTASYDIKGEDIFSLISSINDNLPDEHRVQPIVLKANFDHWWTELRPAIEEAMRPETGENGMPFPWLYSVTDLVIREDNEEWESVWVIHPEPLKDWHLLRAAVRKNLNKGTRYDFIVPAKQVDMLRDLILEEVSRQDEGHSNCIDVSKVRIGSLKQDAFNRLAATHYRVLNPKDDKGPHACVLFQIPIGIDGFWAMAEGMAIENFHVRFKAMREKANLREVCSIARLHAVAGASAPRAARVVRNEAPGGNQVVARAAPANHERNGHPNSRHASKRVRAKR